MICCKNIVDVEFFFYFLPRSRQPLLSFFFPPIFGNSIAIIATIFFPYFGNGIATIGFQSTDLSSKNFANVVTEI